MTAGRVSDAARLGGTCADLLVPGGAIRLETIGSGAPVVFLHGWTLDRRVWLHQASGLAGTHRIIAIDRRGFGQSSAPPDLLREPEDLLELADLLGLERFALVGMSQGARVALAFAARHPDRLSALVVQGAPLLGATAPEEDLPTRELAALAAAGELSAVRELWRRHPLMTVVGHDANATIDAVLSDYAARDLVAPGNQLFVSEADLARIPVPILAVTGANEPASRHRAAQVVTRASGAMRIEIPAAGHLANLDQSAAYNQALGRFLAAGINTHFSEVSTTPAVAGRR